MSKSGMKGEESLFIHRESTAMETYLRAAFELTK